jgi:ribonucleoside-triphosphate reductase
MNNTQELLSNVVVYNKYAKYISELERRETWDEIINRYLTMMVDRYTKNELGQVVDKPFAEEILNNGQYLYSKKVLPSMRALQFAGAAIEKNEARIYNCSYLPMDDYRGFSELMFLLLGGTGVGYSVQYHHIEKLPEINPPTKQAKFLIGDSIEGWSDAVKQLMKSYFGVTTVKPRFDYSDIRPKGSRLVTAGGKAPGPEPLRICLTKIESLLNNKARGSKLTSFEVHRICCLIADAVLAGGIRRAALISLFSFDDKVMATCKHGNWWEKYPELGRANNSVVILRNRVKKEEFDDLWQMVIDSNSGEPGVYFTNDPEYGTNPCCEISLRPFTFCNLTEINAGDVEDAEDFADRARIAAFFGTLQAGFTDFHYLRSIWKTNTEKDALVGVGITGIANGNILDIDMQPAVDMAMLENERVANYLNIRPAARVTTIKPSGTSSCVVGTSSGIHAWHSKQYVRNMQCKVGDDLFTYFSNHHPELIKIMDYDPNSAVIGIPQIAPETAILREDETALQMLDRVLKFNLEWVRAGHRRGPNTNNVSATVSVKPEEWEDVGEWMWNMKKHYNGLSVLPYDGGTYKDAPFMEVDEETFQRKLDYINNNNIDLTLIVEEEDNTTQKDNLACAGGACEIM